MYHEEENDNDEGSINFDSMGQIHEDFFDDPEEEVAEALIEEDSAEEEEEY